jgi:hypothetical protein
MHISVTLRICPGTLSSKVTDRDLCHRNEKEKGKSQPHRVTYLGTFSLMIYVCCTSGHSSVDTFPRSQSPKDVREILLRRLGQDSSTP